MNKDESVHTERAAGVSSSEPGGSELRPIERRRVTRFLCPYCRRGRSKADQIRSHMAGCYRNPAARRCGTCAFLYPAERAEYDYEAMALVYPGCPEHCSAGVIWDEGLKPRGCAEWSLAGRPTAEGKPLNAVPGTKNK